MTSMEPTDSTEMKLPKPVPMGSMVASARRLTSKTLTGGSFKKTNAVDWQEDAWDMYDLVGEQRFLASTLAGRMSQARLFVGKIPDSSVEEPEPIEDENLQAILDAVGGGPSGRAQMIQRLGVNLFVAGDGWLIGIPRRFLPDHADVEVEDEPQPFLTTYPMERGTADLLDSMDEVSMADLEWKMLSVSEVTFTTEKTVKLQLGEAADETIEVTPDEIFLIRVWRPHPRSGWQADSPTRSSLPVLRELVGLTMHISAQVDSRLAGAGMLVIPQSAAAALRAQMQLPEDSDADPFTEALMTAMLTPINDRANASALVPLVVTVPDDVVDKFNYLTFSGPLDGEARELRDEAIRRLALGQDAPPELLLGVGGMNHWGAWLVREDVVTTHLEPPLALICDALTTQYLRPMMLALGYSQAEADEHVIWYDVSHMIMRPNRSSDAMTLHDKGVLSDQTLRAATGFDEGDAPGMKEGETAGERLAALKVEAGLKALELITMAPSLAQEPGLEVLVRQILGVLDGSVLDGPEIDPVEVPQSDEVSTEGDAPAVEGDIPETADDDMEVPDVGMAASAEPYPVYASGAVGGVWPRPKLTNDERANERATRTGADWNDPPYSGDILRPETVEDIIARASR